MKVRLCLGLSVVGLLIVVWAFTAKPFRATAQDNPRESDVAPPARLAVQPVAPAVEPSLPELIANLKELRKQEQILTKAIKEKIKAQKKSLDDTEKELNSLGIETTERQVPQPSPLTPPTTGATTPLPTSEGLPPLSR